MIELKIASLPDRDRVVVELWLGDVQIAEISNEDGILSVEFYATPGRNRANLLLDELEAALRKARETLVF